MSESPNNHNDQPNPEHFAKNFADLLADARKRGQAPPSADAAIKGLDLIADLYKSHPATEQSAKLAVDLAEVLFTNYPEFGTCYLAVATAIDQQ